MVTGISSAKCRSLLSLFLAISIPGMGLAAAAAKPNIVLILADDLGVNDLGCYGRKDHNTPHLDALAAEGVRFTSAYASAPVCSPSRAALLTGKYPARLHLTTFLPGRPNTPAQKLLHPAINQQLPLEEQTLAEILKAAGYATACIGKWHLGNAGFSPADQGFDVAYPGRANTAPSEKEGGKGEYDLTAQAERFMQENREKPFFLYLAHNNPHIPLAAKPELVQKYIAAFHPVYAAMIETLDESVGRIIARIDALGLRERTIVFFLSDNGGLHVPELREDPPTHNSPFRAGKGFLYEGGLRVPWIVRWLGHVRSGAVERLPIMHMDAMPTLLELAGLEVPPRLDGRSFARPLIQGGSLRGRTLFWHYPHYSNQGSRPAGALLDGYWKLMEHYEDGRTELFDLKKDPGEQVDLSSRELGRANYLRAKLAAWRRLMNAQENPINAGFEPGLHRKLYVDTDVSRLRPSGKASEMTPGLAVWRAGMDSVVPRKPATPGR